MYDLHGTECYFVHRRLIRAAGGFITGGAGGAARGFFQPTDRGAQPPRNRNIKFPGTQVSQSAYDRWFLQCTRDGAANPDSCARANAGIPQVDSGGRPAPVGTQFLGGGRESCTPPARVDASGRCVDLSQGAMIGQSVTGAFGLPAMVPQTEERIIRNCGRGMVLGWDNLCYPKQVLPGRSQFRKWRRPIASPFTRRDAKAIQVAARARDRVYDLAKDVGLSVKKGR